MTCSSRHVKSSRRGARARSGHADVAPCAGLAQARARTCAPTVRARRACSRGRGERCRRGPALIDARRPLIAIDSSWPRGAIRHGIRCARRRASVQLYPSPVSRPGPRARGGHVPKRHGGRVSGKPSTRGLKHRLIVPRAARPQPRPR